MSAASKIIASEGNNILKQKLDFIISELARCQKKNGGEWVGSIPEKYFTFMRGDEHIWSPQYTLHKTIMGLVDAYRYTNNEQALEILDHLADWYLRWLDGNPVYASYGEEGGMLEEWVELYNITGNPKYQTLIDYYCNYEIYNPVVNGFDTLTDTHTNNSIQYYLGTSRLYETTNNEYFKKVSQSFWNLAVTDRGMFSTTGHNAGEFWILPHDEGKYLGDKTQEFCGVYNLVRLADYLFRWSGDVKYLDYIERAIYNGFLAQQNKGNGMVSYFLPLGMGSKKLWSDKFSDFWCCLGSMIQAQAMYPELITYEDKENNTIYLAQYISCNSNTTIDNKYIDINLEPLLDYKERSYVEVFTDREKSIWNFLLNITSNEPVKFKLALRIPAWADGYTISLNGEKIELEKENGFVYIDREWLNDKIDIRFKKHLCEEYLDDSKELRCIVDGPIVLAGLVDYDCGLHGDLEKVIIPSLQHTYESVPWKQSTYYTVGQNRNFKLVPLYDITDETYTVYFSKNKE